LDFSAWLLWGSWLLLFLWLSYSLVPEPLIGPPSDGFPFFYGSSASFISPFFFLLRDIRGYYDQRAYEHQPSLFFPFELVAKPWSRSPRVVSFTQRQPAWQRTPRSRLPAGTPTGLFETSASCVPTRAFFPLMCPLRQLLWSRRSQFGWRPSTVNTFEGLSPALVRIIPVNPFFPSADPVVSGLSPFWVPFPLDVFPPRRNLFECCGIVTFLKRKFETRFPPPTIHFWVCTIRFRS